MALKRLGRYEIVGEIGSGGMGLVYKGRDPKIDRLIALKVIRSPVLVEEKGESNALQRFYNEARAAGQLSHPYIVTIFDIGEEILVDGTVTIYIAMELLEGKGLDWHIKKNTYPAMERRVGIIKQIAEAVDYAHKRGVIHRDLKPSNILMVGDSPKITDFGLAKMSDTSMTLSGAVMGTPSYMSPEQIYGKKADHRSDIFSLTVMLYEILTGEKPFPGSNITTIMYKVINENPPPPTTIRPGLPPLVNSIIQKGMSKNPDDRFQSAAEFVKALNAVMEMAESGLFDETAKAPPAKTKPSFASEDATLLMSDGEVTMDFIPSQPAERKSSETAEEARKAQQKMKPEVYYRQKLSELLKKHPEASFVIDDTSLVNGLFDILMKVGFTLHPDPGYEGMNMIAYMTHALKKNHLLLLQYKPKQSNFNLIDVLRGIKRHNPLLTFENFVPIFRATTTSEMQNQLFKFLGTFGIKYCIFIAPNTLLGQNIDEVMAGLCAYNDLLAKDFKIDEKPPPGVSATEQEDLETYKGLLRLGDELMKSGRHAEAIKVLSEAIALNADPKILLNRGDAYYKVKKYVPALNDYREANRLEQESPTPYAKVGACCLILAKQAAIKEGPEKARKWFDVGLKRLQEAEKLIEKMEHDNRDFPEKLPKTPYAPILSALHEADFQDTPGFAEGQKLLAELVSRVVHKTKEVNSEDQEISLDTLIDRAVLLGVNSNLEEAEKLFGEILPKDPVAVGPAFNNFAIVSRKRGDLARSFRIYTELLKHPVPEKHIVTENMKTAGLRYGSELRKKGMINDAKAVYNTVLSYNPRNKEWVLLELAMAMLENRETAEAGSKLMEAIFLNPGIMKTEEFKPYRELEKLYEEMLKRLNQARG
ncbi:MAG: protein kinase [Nitrospinae bacterium]|nr:protein kinase [Nitrospinota bacterium]